MSEKELKSQNVLPLTAIYAGAILLVSFCHWGIEEVFAISRQIGKQAILVAALTSFGGVLSHCLPNYVKHPLVYLRIRNALSGHRCKSICLRDSRFVREDLERQWPDVFLSDMKESEQNAYWYSKIYRPVRNRPEVLQAHRSFLLFRDAASGLVVLLVGLLLWKALSGVVSVPPVNVWTLAILVALIVLLSQAARQSGDRMVSNAVAATMDDEPGDG